MRKISGYPLISYLSHHSKYYMHRALSDMLAPHRSTKAALSKGRPHPSLDTTPRTSEDTVVDAADAPVPVLPSSTELFYFYGQNLDQCAKLSTGKPLFNLCKVHKKWLKIYAGMSFLVLSLCVCSLFS